MYLVRNAPVGTNVSWEVMDDDPDRPSVMIPLGVTLHVKKEGVFFEGGTLVPDNEEERREIETMVAVAKVAHKFVLFEQKCPTDDELLALVERGNPPPPG